MSHSTFSEAHLSRGSVWLSWWPLTCLQYHLKVYFRTLWSIADMRSKWLERHEYLVSQSIDFFIAFRPSHAIVIETYRMLNFRLIYSIIDTTWNMPAGLLLYASWSLGCPGILQVALIWRFA